MKLELESDRLLLRPLNASDFDIGCAIFMDPEVMEYLGRPYSEQQVADELEVAVRRCGGGCIGVWCVLDRVSQEKLGTALLLPLPVEEEDTNWDLVQGDALPDAEIEVGYLLKRSAWGKGYATEVVRRLLRFAFEESPLQDVVAVIDSGNKGSRRVLEKCGLRYEGERRAYASSCPGFRITRRHWEELTG